MPEQTPVQQGRIAAVSGWIVAAFLLLTLLVVSVRSCGPARERHQEQREAVSLEGATLVFVSEKQTPSADEILFTDKANAFAESKGIGRLLWLDEEEEQGAKVAEMAGVKPPVVALVKDRKVLKAVQWTASLDLEALAK